MNFVKKPICLFLAEVGMSGTDRIPEIIVGTGDLQVQSIFIHSQINWL